MTTPPDLVLDLRADGTCVQCGPRTNSKKHDPNPAIDGSANRAQTYSPIDEEKFNEMVAIGVWIVMISIVAIPALVVIVRLSRWLRRHT